jgi:glycosyltransferase involved in cell wall biosynthesis
MWAFLPKKLKMQNKTISIIIATYNSGLTLKECLDSLLAQTNLSLNIIIIDGNSTDNTKDIIHRYEAKIKYYISEPDNGVYDAWNKGLLHIDTDWVMFLGSDDVLYPNAIENYIRYIEKNKDKNLILSKAELIDKNKEIIRVIGGPWNFLKFRRYMNIVHTGSIHHVSLFQKFGEFNSKYKIAGDYEFLSRCERVVNAGFIDSVMMKMGYGGLSTKNIHKVFFETFYIKNKILKINIWVNIFDLLLSYLKHYRRFFLNVD